MIIAGERDGDLTYPIADQFIDRAVGPTTFMTLYGGNHNQLGDTGLGQDATPTITRLEQQTRICNYVVAFIKRWSATTMDLSVEGLLYNNELAGSATGGICAWRNMMERLDVDDFQDGASATNLLTGANNLTGATRTEASNYPSIGLPGYATLGIKHNIMSNFGTTGTYTTSFTARDVSKCLRLTFRSSQNNGNGYDDVTFRVKLVDQGGALSIVTLFDRTAPTATYLPDYTGTGAASTFRRFVDGTVMLSSFTGVNLAQVTSIEFIYEFAAAPAANRAMVLDAIRFE